MYYRLNSIHILRTFIYVILKPSSPSYLPLPLCHIRKIDSLYKIISLNELRAFSCMYNKNGTLYTHTLIYTYRY